MNHLIESHNIELKSVWKDEYLKQICGFSNADGGMMYIGVNDKGKVIGLENVKRLLEEIPNKAANLMGVILKVNLLYENGLPFILISVPKNSLPVSLRGKYYSRSGTTTQEMNGTALYSFLLNRHNLSWDEVGIETASFDDIDSFAVKKFIELAIDANRLTSEARMMDHSMLLKNLHLLDESNHIRRSALLAFARNPIRFFPSMYVKIGRFMSETNIVVQDVIESNLFTMIENVMDILKAKYLKSLISYRGLSRIEQLEYPVNALREAILNALIHRDYTGSFTQIRVNNDNLEIWNAGLLPEELKIEMLFRQHASIPRNRSLANLFFRAGYIESWGRGTIAIAQECHENGLPAPSFSEQFGGFTVAFYKPGQVTPQDTPQDTPQVTTQVTSQVSHLVVVISGEMTRKELQEALEIKDREYFRRFYLIEAINSGLIEMSIPDKPKSKNQRYRLTPKGKSLVKSHPAP